MTKIFKFLATGAILVVLYIGLLKIATTPKNDRNWVEDERVLSSLEISTSSAIIQNIKNFAYPYENEEHKTASYYSDKFEPEKVKNVWFFQNDFVEPLGAHTFLTFEFEDDKYLSFSAEVRKEVGESYSPFKGLLNHYELQYLLVSEKDILTLRAALREPPVYMYKLKLDKNEKVKLFQVVLARAEKVNQNPEFYNTYNNSCTTNIFDHLNQALEKNHQPGFSWKIIFPKYADNFLYQSGLIDTGLSFEEIKQTAKVNQKVKEALKNNLNDVEFSKFIRQNYTQESRV
jgi:hypothetical protein